MGKTHRARPTWGWDDPPTPRQLGGYGYCKRHRKRFFRSRAAAKKFLRYRFAHEQMNIYRCGNRDLYHVGHLLPAVKLGLATRDGQRWLADEDGGGSDVWEE